MTRSTAMQTFIQNLERIRIERGMNQVELAELLGTTQGNISRLLRGGEDVTLTRAEKIAEMLGLRLSEMLEEHAVA